LNLSVYQRNIDLTEEHFETGKDTRMKWLILLAATVDWSFVSVMHADDYRLRIETLECNSESEVDCEESVVACIEVVTRPGEKLQTKVVQGARTLIFKGKLVQNDDGGFAIQIRYVRTLETSDFISVAENVRQPVIEVSSVSTTVKVAVGTPLTVGRTVSSKVEHGKDPKVTKSRVVLTLTKDDSEE
jgi:hypothetical protein